MKQVITQEAYAKAELELAHKVSHMGISVTPAMVENYISQQQKAA
tara:strand:- start:1570 stop:1704 length:135 start_codon:yes stop_codon:yes gene_type:complete